MPLVMLSPWVRRANKNIHSEDVGCGEDLDVSYPSAVQLHVLNVICECFLRRCCHLEIFVYVLVGF